MCGLASGVETGGAGVCGVGCLAWGYAGYVHTDTSRPRVLAISGYVHTPPGVLAMFERLPGEHSQGSLAMLEQLR